MLEELDRVAVMGGKDLVFIFRALGIKVFSPRDVEEAREILEDLEKKNIALCFVHQSLLDPLGGEGGLREKTHSSGCGIF